MGRGAAHGHRWCLSFASPQEAEDNASIRDSGVAKVDRQSLDHLIGTGKQHLRDYEAESFRRPEIDHEFEFRRRPNGKIRRLRTAKDATGIFRGTPVTDTEQS
jgi:hypothetical protein